MLMDSKLLAPPMDRALSPIGSLRLRPGPTGPTCNTEFSRASCSRAQRNAGVLPSRRRTAQASWGRGPRRSCRPTSAVRHAPLKRELCIERLKRKVHDHPHSVVILFWVLPGLAAIAPRSPARSRRGTAVGREVLPTPRLPGSGRGRSGCAAGIEPASAGLKQLGHLDAEPGQDVLDLEEVVRKEPAGETGATDTRRLSPPPDRPPKRASRRRIICETPSGYRLRSRRTASRKSRSIASWGRDVCFVRISVPGLATGTVTPPTSYDSESATTSS